MSISVVCPDCGASLKVADEHVGKAVRCGKCRGIIETQSSRGIVAVLPPEAIAPQPPFQTRLRKRRLKKKDLHRHRFPVRVAVGLGLGGIFFILVGVFVYWVVRYGFDFRAPPAIPDDKWQALEIPNRLKARLPGAAQVINQPIAGMTMIMHQYAPNNDSFYAVAYLEGVLPENRRALPLETLLNDSCDGSVRNLSAQGGVEESRQSIQLGPHPGKELVVRIRRAGGKVISRIYIVNRRLYIVMAGGAGLRPDHENVKRLFDSFEIIEKPGDSAVPTPSPSSTQASTKAESSKPPFKVDPKLVGEWSEVYLSEMKEFDVQMGPWQFGKNGVLGDPKNTAIVTGEKKSPKGLGMHPTVVRPVRVRYALGKQAAKFVAAVALNEYPTPCPGMVTFEVLGDNKVLWTSKPIQARGDIQECKVDVAKISILELRVTVTGTEWNAHAVWLEPRLLKK
jgi:predicted Zn finger-like uncharacterized protein